MYTFALRKLFLFFLFFWKRTPTTHPPTHTQNQLNQTRMSAALLRNRSSWMKAFNVLFREFFQFMILVFPDNADILHAHESLDGIRKLNPTIIIKVWEKYIYSPYKSMIDNRDLSFFLEKNYEPDLAMFANVREIVNIIDTLRIPLQSLAEIHQQRTMDFLQNLSKLAIMYTQPSPTAAEADKR